MATQEQLCKKEEPKIRLLSLYVITGAIGGSKRLLNLGVRGTYFIPWHFQQFSEYFQ